MAADRWSERRLLARLAVPLVLGHAGSQLMSIVDTAMVGHLSKAALGGVGLGGALWFGLTSIGMGVIMGVDAPIAQAIGAGEPARARRVLWQGVRLAVSWGLVLTTLLALTPLALPALGVKPAVAASCRGFVWARLPNVIPFLIFVAQRSYLQAVGVARPIVIATVVGNVVNALLDWWFIYGLGLGATGAGLATSAVSIAMVAVLAAAIARVPTPEDPARRAAEPALARTVRGLGLPLGLQIFAEVLVFAFAGVFASRLSETASAAHQIAINLASLTFTMALGLGAATSVRVGHYVGRGDTPGARGAGFDGLLLSLLVMGVGGLVFVGLGRPIAALLSRDADVIELATTLLAVAAVFQLSDGIQAVVAGALRGAGDSRSVLVANVIGHYAVGLPVSLALGIWLGMGAPGLWWGLSAGLTGTAILLVVRFRALTRVAIARV